MRETTSPSEPRIRSPDKTGIDRAADLLAAGQLVAVPTETVYGLAARADRDAAVAAIYTAKGRPAHNPLIVHVPSLDAAERIARFDDRGRQLAQAFWPGPLTLVLPSIEKAGLAASVTAGLRTIAVRVPAHPVFRRLLERCDFPVAAPSANRSGAISPTLPSHVAQSLAGRDVLILDGGACEAGLESTIVAIRENGWEILRPGPIDSAAIEKILGVPGTFHPSSKIEAPGQLASHYSPGKPVRLDVTSIEPDEFLIGFARVSGDYSLSPSGDLKEAGSRLYEALHRAAASDRPRIAVAPIPPHGLGIAIRDRLKRAATPA